MQFKKALLKNPRINPTESFLKANSRSATQDIPSTLGNSKVHIRLRKSAVIVPILGQMNPGHVLTYSFDIHIIHLPTCRSSKWR